MTKSLIKNENCDQKYSLKGIWCRNSTITGQLIGRRVKVYNGREFKSFLVTREKVGYKMGEFSFTRKKTVKKKSIKKALK